MSQKPTRAVILLPGAVNFEAVMASFGDWFQDAMVIAVDKGIDKAKALDEVFPPMGFSKENMIAFGDGQNDRSIIEYAGIGVAMGNAVQEILDLADEVTSSDDEDGIAEFLDRYF